MDAGPQEVLGATESAGRAVQSIAEFAEIIGGAIGELMVGLGPHVLGRIELRRIRREVMDIEPRMVGQERADLSAAMDRAAIPQEHGGAAQVAEQVPEEGVDVEAREIPRPTAE